MFLNLWKDAFIEHQVFCFSDCAGEMCTKVPGSLVARLACLGTSVDISLWDGCQMFVS